MITQQLATSRISLLYFFLYARTIRDGALQALGTVSELSRKLSGSLIDCRSRTADELDDGARRVLSIRVEQLISHGKIPFSQNTRFSHGVSN